MKHFIAVIPMQNPSALKRGVYQSSDTENALITSDLAVSFPILIPMANAAEAGETVRLTTILLPEHPNTKVNYARFQEELNEIAANKGFHVELNEIPLAYSETAGDHMKLFEKLMDALNDDELLYVCLTYGSKPIPMVMQTALNFAYRLKKNTSVEAVVYGQMNFASGQMVLYEVSPLFYLNSVVNTVSEMNAKDPVGYIKMMLELTSNSQTDETR